MSPNHSTAYGHDVGYWNSNSTMPSCRTAIRTWGTPDQKPKSNAKKLDLVQAAMNVVMNRTPRPSEAQFRTIMSGGQLPAQPLQLQTSGSRAGPSGPARPNSPAPVAGPSGIGDSNKPPAPLQAPQPATGPVYQLNKPQIPEIPERDLVALDRRRPLVVGNDEAARRNNWNRIFEDVQVKAFHRGAELAKDAERTISKMRPRTNLISPNLRDFESLFNDEDDPHISEMRVRFYDYPVTQGPFNNRTNAAGHPPDAHFPVQEYAFSAAGKLYPYRGKGPPWENNSCALDCVIIAARLLDLGLITADIGDQSRQTWLNLLDDFERSFLDVVHSDWDIFTRKTGQARRRLFYDQLLTRLNSTLPEAAPPYRPGQFLPSARLWAECTSMANQFTFYSYLVRTCSSCGDTRSLRNESGESHNSITLPEPFTDQDPDTDMETLLREWFGVPNPARFREHRSGCKAMGQFRRQVIVGGMPQRLAVFPSHTRKNIPGATNDNISFRFLDEEEREHEVTYRWLGGIYCQVRHFRVYWRDSSYPDRSGNIKIYDGQLLDGAIIGGVPPQHPDYKVVDWWADGTDMLFYERVDTEDRAISTKTTFAVSERIGGLHSARVQGLSGLKPADNSAPTAGPSGTSRGGHTGGFLAQAGMSQSAGKEDSQILKNKGKQPAGKEIPRITENKGKQPAGTFATGTPEDTRRKPAGKDHPQSPQHKGKQRAIDEIPETPQNKGKQAIRQEIPETPEPPNDATPLSGTSTTQEDHSTNEQPAIPSQKEDTTNLRPRSPGPAAELSPDSRRRKFAAGTKRPRSESSDPITESSPDPRNAKVKFKDPRSLG